MDAASPALAAGTDVVEAASQAVAPAPAGTPWARLKALPPKRKWAAAGGLAALLLLVLAVLMAGQSASWAPLYSSPISERDAGAIVAQLKQMGARWRISDGEHQILVPADKVGELKMALANQGLPKGKPTAGGIMEQSRFGQSSEQERFQRQRALEAELVHSIGSLEAVQEARVHLAVPAQNGFFREQVKPSASVVLTLHTGHTLDRRQVAGIVHLVSSSVPELSPKAVSVIDQEGTLLTQSPDGDGRQDLTQQQRKMVLDLENQLAKRIVDTLDAPIGKDNLRATVTADLDFDQLETTTENYAPNQTPDSAAVRSQRIVEQSGPGQPQPTGVPGAVSNTPPTPATAPASGPAQALQAAQSGNVGGGVRKEQLTNYENSKTVALKRQASGNVRRMHVAVVVNHRSVTDAKGKTSTQPLPDEQLKELTEVVKGIVGYDDKRGDSVKVVSIPFRADLYPKPEVLPVWKQPWLLDLVKTAAVPTVLLLVAMTLVLAVIRPALKKDPPPAEAPEKVLNAVVDGPEALPSPSESTALLGHEEDISPFMAEQLEDARLLARENPLAVANILRAWLNGDATA